MAAIICPDCQKLTLNPDLHHCVTVRGFAAKAERTATVLHGEKIAAQYRRSYHKETETVLALEALLDDVRAGKHLEEVSEPKPAGLSSSTQKTSSRRA